MSTINIHTLVSKEIFALEIDGKEKLWMVSGFEDEHNDNEWYNIYDYDVVSLTGEFVPYFTAGGKVQTITYYGEKRSVLLLADLNNKMQEQGFVWKYPIIIDDNYFFVIIKKYFYNYYVKTLS